MSKLWKRTDQLAAAKQGWLLNTPTIERVDDPVAWFPRTKATEPRFDSDAIAAAYVQGRADAGCPLAVRAIMLCEHARLVKGVTQ